MQVCASEKADVAQLPVHPAGGSNKPLGRDERSFALSLMKYPKELLLDVGTGDCACIASILAPHGTPVLAVDKDELTVRHARNFLEEHHIKGVRVQQDNIASSNLPSDEFPNIVCFNVLHHVPELERAVAGLHRILAANGRLIISEIDENQDGFLGRLEREVDRRFRSVTPYHRRNGRLVLSCEK